MNDAIVFSDDPVLLVGGANGDNGLLSTLLDEAGLVVAADSGADWIRALGRMPDALIGDLDSVSEATVAAMPPGQVHRISEQNTTDFDKAVRSISAPLIIGIGFNGLAIFGAPTFYQYVFQGAILIAAVGLSTVARRYATR